MKKTNFIWCSIVIACLIHGFKANSQPINLEFITNTNALDSASSFVLDKLPAKFDFCICFQVFEGRVKTSQKATVVAKKGRKWYYFTYLTTLNTYPAQGKIMSDVKRLPERCIRELLSFNILSLPDEEDLPPCSQELLSKEEKSFQTVFPVIDGVQFKVEIFNDSCYRIVNFGHPAYLYKYCPDVKERGHYMEIIEFFDRLRTGKI